MTNPAPPPPEAGFEEIVAQAIDDHFDWQDGDHYRAVIAAITLAHNRAIAQARRDENRLSYENSLEFTAADQVSRSLAARGRALAELEGESK